MISDIELCGCQCCKQIFSLPEKRCDLVLKQSDILLSYFNVVVRWQVQFTCNCAELMYIIVLASSCRYDTGHVYQKKRNELVCMHHGRI